LAQVLPDTVLSVSVAVPEARFQMPEPWEYSVQPLPDTVLLVSVRVPTLQTALVLLPDTVLLVSVSVPKFEMALQLSAPLLIVIPRSSRVTSS
jgi:hypothetical protein